MGMPRYVARRKKTGTPMIGAMRRIQKTSFRSCLIKTSSCAIFLGIVIFFRKSRNTTEYRLSQLLRFCESRSRKEPMGLAGL